LTVEFVRELSAQAIRTLLLAAGPALLVSLVVGLVISFFQAITQIQEFTLTFVPKMVAVFLCLFILLPWISRVLVSFTKNLIENIPVYVR